MLFERVSRKILLAPPRTPAYSVVRHDWIFKRLSIQWSDETKKKSFLAVSTLEGFGGHEDKKYPMCTILYIVGSLMLGAYFSAEGPGLLIQIHGIVDSIKYQHKKIKT